MNSDKQVSHSGLSDIYSEGENIAAYYDRWADNYDQTLKQWRYDAPERVAQLVQGQISPDSQILDVGCGTGLCGKALSEAGFKLIDGIDVSRDSIKTAQASGGYRNLQLADLQRLPLSIPGQQYNALICVGVMTYLPDSLATLTEFCRIVKPGGLVALTQRSDLYVERSFEKTLNKLAAQGLIKKANVSEPLPYLPDHNDFSNEILVHYITFRVT